MEVASSRSEESVGGVLYEEKAKRSPSEVLHHTVYLIVRRRTVITVNLLWVIPTTL